MIGTMNLPTIPELEQRCRALALLDALLSPVEFEFRYFSFNENWGEGMRMASFSDNCGSDFFILFTADGKAAIKGFDPMYNRADPTLVQAEIPSELHQNFRDEPAFSMQEITFCMWNLGDGWVSSAHNDEEALIMLHHLVSPASEYVIHAQDSFEISMPEELVRRAYALEPLTLTQVTKLCPNLDIASLSDIDDLGDIGYPLSE